MTIRMDAGQVQALANGKLDAAQSIFFARELESIDERQFEVKYAQLEAFQLVPVSSTDHPGDETYTYEQYDGRAIAEITSNYASGSPRADVDGQEFTSRFRSLRNSYGYNVQEIRAAQKAGKPLDAMRANVARRGINEKIEEIALKGNAEHGLIGLFNQPNAQTFTVPAGASTDTEWTSKTSDEIIADVIGMLDQVPTTTNEAEQVKRVLLPYTRFRLIRTKRMGPGDGSATVLSYLQEKFPQVEFRGALHLDTAGVGGTMRMVGYDPAPETIELRVPVAFESFPPQVQGMEFVIENHARIGGVVLRYPLSMIYADGI